MKEKFFAFLPGVFGMLSPTLAQYADLLNDRNISWVAEYTTEFTLSPLNGQSMYYDIGYEADNELNVMQLSDIPQANGLFKEQQIDRYFSKKMLDAIREDGYLLFEDEQLEIPIAGDKIPEYMIRIDTIAGPDPESYDEPGFVIVQNEISPGDIKSFKVRQVFFYNKTEKIFGSRVLAIAPVIYVYDPDGITGTKVMFWVKIELPKNTLKITPQDVTYAFETKMRGNAPEAQDFVLKKGRIDFLTLIVNEVSKPSHLILNRDFKAIDPAKLQDYVQSTDTVTTYNPETYEEQTRIVQSNAIKDVHQIGFVQHWFFDDRKKLLFNRVVAVAPLINLKDPEGNLQYSKPLFYMMNE